MGQLNPSSRNHSLLNWCGLVEVRSFPYALGGFQYYAEQEREE
jgi:hypothetical protein